MANNCAISKLSSNEKNYCCYLLYCDSKMKRANKCYIGYTVDPKKRLKQHNGLQPGGAKQTAKWKGHWKLVFYISGFKYRTGNYFCLIEKGTSKRYLSFS